METESRLAQGSTVAPCHNGQDGIGSLVVGFLMGAGIVGLIWAVASHRPVKPDSPDNRFLGHWEILGPDMVAHLAVFHKAGFFLTDAGDGTVSGAIFTPHFDGPVAKFVGPLTESTVTVDGNVLKLISGGGLHYTFERARGEDR